MDLPFLLEWTASLLGLLYLWLIAKKNKWAWFFGGISSFCYIFVFYKSEVYAQAYLSVAYVLMSCYAFWSWGKENELTLISWSLRKHLSSLMFLVLLGALILWLKKGTFTSFSEKETFVLDLFLALFSLFATLLGLLKEKSNWIYWIFINLGCILLFIQQSLYPTVLLYICYFLLGIYGFKQWNKKHT